MMIKMMKMRGKGSWDWKICRRIRTLPFRITIFIASILTVVEVQRERKKEKNNITPISIPDLVKYRLHFQCYITHLNTVLHNLLFESDASGDGGGSK